MKNNLEIGDYCYYSRYGVGYGIICKVIDIKHVGNVYEGVDYTIKVIQSPNDSYMLNRTYCTWRSMLRKLSQDQLSNYVLKLL